MVLLLGTQVPLGKEKNVKRVFETGLSVFVCLIGLAWGQNIQTPLPASGLQEPENHAIVVDRLMRYHDSGEYEREIREVVNSARDYLEERFPGKVPKGAKLAAVFDIDETSLSSWDIMAYCGFCSYPAQLQLYKDKPELSLENDPAIPPVLELFNFVRDKGIAVFFVTGRPKSQHDLTVASLEKAGYSGWTEPIYMQEAVPPGQQKPPAHIFKPKDRQDIESKGYKIVLNIGDQASDLSGCCALRVFKLPNPFYLLP
jgi:predicted secreted acid phosphatase